jgi:polyhydroxyalkanoate synthesis regulator phasin
VESARQLLDAMSPDTVAKIRAKQAAALVLTKQAELIKNMVSEGLLTPQHAEEFLEEIGDDLQRMDKDRNRMYWYVSRAFLCFPFVF